MNILEQAMKVFALVLALAMSCSCSNQKSGADKEMQMTEYVNPGILTKVEYSHASGTTRGDDFGIVVSQTKILAATYFDWDDLEQKDIENIPITPEQWKQIEEAVLAIVPVLKEDKLSKQPNNQSYQYGLLDGNDSSSFTMTWEKDGIDTCVNYSTPQDMRFFTLKNILEETANPIGREIVYYEASVPVGINFTCDGIRKTNRKRTNRLPRFMNRNWDKQFKEKTGGKNYETSFFKVTCKK